MRPQNLFFTALLALLPTLAPAFQPLFDTWVSYPIAGYSVISADLDADGDRDLVIATGNGINIQKNNGDATFTQGELYTGGNTRSIIACDLDNDGDQDVAATFGTYGLDSNTVAIYRNNGDGSFAPRVNFEVGRDPRSVYAADLDGDGDQDLVTANANLSFALDSGTISILKNNGDATFAAKSDYVAGFSTRFVFASDLDGDGDFDLAAANQGYSTRPSSISIFKNNGDATFPIRTELNLGYFPKTIKGADFDGDGDIDLAFEDLSETITILENNGSGGFAQKVAYPTGNSTSNLANSISISDLDNDGNWDIILVGSVCSILYNNGDGTFNIKKFDGLPGFSMDASDLDGDGFQDLAIVGEANLSIVHNKGYGDFPSRTDYSVGSYPSSAFVVDINKDGFQDLIVAGGSSPYISSGWVSILKNKGDGSLLMGSNTLVGPWPTAIFCGDLDGDGAADLAVTKERLQLCDRFGCYYTGEDAVLVLANVGDTSFAQKAKILTGDSPSSVFAVDLDGDGDLDLVIANRGSNNVSILKNEGNWSFASKVDYATGGSPSSIFASDLDGDTDQDLAIAYGNGVSILKNYGNGSFAQKTDFGYGSYKSVVAADLDGDGDLDLAAANPYKNVAVLLNNGDATFVTPANYETRNWPSSIVAADLDGDGDKDLAVTDYGDVTAGNTVAVLKNIGNATFESRMDYRAGSRPYTVVASDLDRDGDMELITANAGTNTISVLTNLSNTGCANKPGDLNHDCLLTLGDIVPELNCVFLGIGDCRLTLTDVNCSGAATPADVVLLLLAVFAAQPLPCP